MGIYPRLAAALLTLLVVSAEAATRQTVNHGQTARNIINGQNATTGSVSTPAGAAAFFGQAYTSYHTPGERFNGGDSVPNSGSGSGSTAKQPVNVKPGAFFNKARAAAMAVNALKGGVVGVVATAAAGYAIEQIMNGEFINGQPSTVTSAYAAGNNEYTRWYRQTPRTYKATAEDACKIYGADYKPHPENYNKASSYVECRRPAGGDYKQVEHGDCLEIAGPFNPGTGLCDLQYVPPAEIVTPFTEQNYADFQAALSSMNNNPWLQDLIKASCEGSLNPDGCYNSLVDNPFTIGPSSQTGTPKSTTTTTTNPDGTTSTSTVTSTPSYSYTYGSNYYDYTTTMTTTTNNNGQVTTTVSTDTSEGTPQEDPASEEEKEEETDFSGEYTDAPFAEVTPFYEQKYPDGLQGVWDSASAQVSSSAFLQFLQSFVPSFSGSCPSWSLSFNILPQAMFGTLDFMSLCYVFDFVKIILMATAVFYSRAIMFGG